MADLEVETRLVVRWEHVGLLKGEKRIRVILGENDNPTVLFDETIPADKQLRGRISIQGRVEDKT